jgi:hypothetical protein
MVNLDEIVDELESLTPESLEELDRFIRYLKWKESPGPAAAGGRLWTFDFAEGFHHATVTADHGSAGMEVRVGEAACGGETLMALWQHPPVQGASIVEYQVPVPAEVRNLRLHFATGIRDGSKLAAGNIVAFRIFVDDWRMWSDTQRERIWRHHEVEMPAVAGDVLRIQFVTDGLGNHEWAWAAWGAPRLVGTVMA